MPVDKLVSAIIPTFNRAHVVCHAVESALAQTYPLLEIIVVDDGSTDTTLSKLTRFGGRIRVVSQGNRGPGPARNRGIAESRGEFVAFLDSDDTWLPEKIQREIALMERAPGGVPCCLCDSTIVYRDGTRSSSFRRARAMPDRAEGLWLNPLQVLSTRFVLFNQAVVVRRASLARVGSFDETLRFAEDYDLPLRLALEGPWGIVRDELVVTYAANDDSWGEKALREETRYREDLIRMWERLLAICEHDARHAALRRLMRRRVRQARRDLRITRLKRTHSFPAAVAGGSLRFAGRVCDGLVRRSPFYPHPRVLSLTE